jgi:hypothetical protein
MRMVACHHKPLFSTLKFTNRFNILNAAVTCTATTTTVSVTATNGVGALTFLITGTTSATALQILDQ